jgi:hypothetical protein
LKETLGVQAPNSLAQRAAGAAWWSSLEILARFGVQFFVMVVLAHLLTPADFGLIAMLLVFTSVGTVLVDSGFGAALVQRQKNTADDETTVFIFTISVGVVAASILIFCAPSIASFFDQPKLVDLTRVIAVVLPLGAFAAVPDALLTMKLDFKALRLHRRSLGIKGIWCLELGVAEHRFPWRTRTSVVALLGMAPTWSLSCLFVSQPVWFRRLYADVFATWHRRCATSIAHDWQAV